MINHLNEKVGKVFNEDNIDDFDRHIQHISVGGTSQISKRINLLFGWISNVRFMVGDNIEVNTTTFLELTLLKEYNFSMLNELGVLCSKFISTVKNKNFTIDSQEKFDLFREIVFKVDDVVRENKIPDSNGSVILIDMLSKHLFNIESND